VPDWNVRVMVPTFCFGSGIHVEQVLDAVEFLFDQRNRCFLHHLGRGAGVIDGDGQRWRRYRGIASPPATDAARDRRQAR